MSRFLFALTTVLLLGATSAHALVQRAYVSALTGNDANTATDCQATAPCRWFAGAISVVASGGEIVAMDTGAYGTVTITKSIAIVAAPGVYGGITVFSGDGITIATAGVNVLLRGLTINRIGGSGSGINMSLGSSLTVQNCTITNFLWRGIDVSAVERVEIIDSLLQGNFVSGITLSNGVSGLVSGTRLIKNGVGLEVACSACLARLEVNRSEAAANINVGISAMAFPGGQVHLTVRDSMISRSDTGLSAQTSGGGSLLANVGGSLIADHTNSGIESLGSAKVIVSGNTVTRNGTGLLQSGSAILQTTGDNTMHDNTTPTSGTISSLSKF